MHYKINYHSYCLSSCLYIGVKEVFAGLSNAFFDPNSCYGNIAHTKKEIDWAYVRDKMQASEISPRESQEKWHKMFSKAYIQEVIITDNLFARNVSVDKNIWHA